MINEHYIIIDESSKKSINSQNLNISAGKPCDNNLTVQVKNFIEPLLNKEHSRLFKYYGDVFYSRQLVRFKFLIEPLKDYKSFLELLKDELLKRFKIKKLTYLEDDSETMLLIWM